MIARWVLTANVFLTGFNVTLIILNGLLLWRIKVARNQLTKASADLTATIADLHRFNACAMAKIQRVDVSGEVLRD